MPVPAQTTTSALPRPAERVAIISLLLVFLCGAGAGAVAMSYWGHTVLHSPSPGGNGFKLSILELNSQLDLTEDQTRQLTSVLDDFAHYYDNLLADGNSRVMQILNPDQKVRYERMIREHKK